MPRILIADDHPILRHGLTQILQAAFADAVVGGAASSAEALSLIASAPWDVIVLDITMPGRNGFEVLDQLRQTHPDIPVLILSSTPEEQLGLRALRCGAAGYLNKQVAPENLVGAVRTLLDGGRFISEALASRMTDELQRRDDRPRHETLSNREYQVLQLSVKGRSVKEIAFELSLSSKTISTFRSRIFHKLGVQTDADLVNYARDVGLT